MSLLRAKKNETYRVYTSNNLHNRVARLEDGVNNNAEDGTKHPCNSNCYPSRVAFRRIHCLSEEQRKGNDEYKHKELAFSCICKLFVNRFGNACSLLTKVNEEIEANTNAFRRATGSRSSSWVDLVDTSIIEAGFTAISGSFSSSLFSVVFWISSDDDDAVLNGFDVLILRVMDQSKSAGHWECLFRTVNTWGRNDVCHTRKEVTVAITPPMIKDAMLPASIS